MKLRKEEVLFDVRKEYLSEITETEIPSPKH